MLGNIKYSNVGKKLANTNIGLYLDFLSERSAYTISNKFYEYLSMGMVVIGCNKPPTRKFNQKENCCYLVNPKSSREIAEAILWILKSREGKNNGGKWEKSYYKRI